MSKQKATTYYSSSRPTKSTHLSCLEEHSGPSFLESVGRHLQGPEDGLGKVHIAEIVEEGGKGRGQHRLIKVVEFLKTDSGRKSRFQHLAGLDDAERTELLEDVCIFENSCFHFGVRLDAADEGAARTVQHISEARHLLRELTTHTALLARRRPSTTHAPPGGGASWVLRHWVHSQIILRPAALNGGRVAPDLAWLCRQARGWVILLILRVFLFLLRVRIRPIFLRRSLRSG